MEFRKLEEKDCKSLERLEKANFISPWTYEQFVHEVTKNEFARTFGYFDNGELIGYINYWVIFDQCTLNKICINKAYRRQGFAQKLLDKMISEAKENECMVITLEVRVSNGSAISLYEKNNFETVVTKESYYSDGEDAFYMVKGVY